MRYSSSHCTFEHNGFSYNTTGTVLHLLTDIRPAPSQSRGRLGHSLFIATTGKLQLIEIFSCLLIISIGRIIPWPYRFCCFVSTSSDTNGHLKQYLTMLPQTTAAVYTGSGHHHRARHVPHFGLPAVSDGHATLPTASCRIARVSTLL